MLHNSRSLNAWFIIAASLYFFNLQILLKGSCLLEGTPSLATLQICYSTAVPHERKITFVCTGECTLERAVDCIYREQPKHTL